MSTTTKLDATIQATEENLAILKLENEKLKKGNKSAATRARNAAMDIHKDMKTYRGDVTDFKNSL